MVVPLKSLRTPDIIWSTRNSADVARDRVSAIDTTYPTPLRQPRHRRRLQEVGSIHSRPDQHCCSSVILQDNKAGDTTDEHLEGQTFIARPSDRLEACQRRRETTEHSKSLLKAIVRITGGTTIRDGASLVAFVDVRVLRSRVYAIARKARYAGTCSDVVFWRLEVLNRRRGVQR